jgi:G:T/U-mismatch repair DNA glycosylase
LNEREVALKKINKILECMKEIMHQSISNKWDELNLIKNPKILILGSFNPYNPNNNKNTDYYYGRSSNHFWKSIARNLNFHEDFFYNNPERKFEVMNKYHFCFLDIINSLKIECENDNFLNNFIESNIYSGYSDNIIFTTKTKLKSAKSNINIKRAREYNHKVFDLLNSKTIKTVIHTMGNSRITQNLEVKPLEKGLKEKGLHNYFNRIIDTCKENNVYFEKKSFSPSDYAISTKKTNINDLDNWIKENLLEV